MRLAINIREVARSFGATQVLKGVSIPVLADTTTALVGESGSGKSTLLQLINGLLQPDSGSVEVFDELIDYADLPRLRRKMGYAVQGAGLFPHLTIRGNITLVATLEGWSEDDIEQRYLYLLDLLGLSRDFSDRYPHSLSGGQQQRVSLCRAMMLNPPLMLLDEPFSALDPITRELIHDEFLKLQAAEARTILLVTHDMTEAIKLASQLVILKEGEVVGSGDIDTVRAMPNDYIQHLFLGNV